MLKCRKCRNNLVNIKHIPLLNEHGELVAVVNNKASQVCISSVSDNWYFQDPDIPEWMTELINQCDWQKGKLICPSCDARVGSFNFVSGMKCHCKKNIVPPIHIVKSKVDVTELL